MVSLRLSEGLVISVGATGEQSPKRLNEGAKLTHNKLLEVPVTLVEGASRSLSEVKSEGRQFLSTRYLADFEESPVAAPEKLVSIDVLASALEGAAGWNFAELTEGPELSR